VGVDVRQANKSDSAAIAHGTLNCARELLHVEYKGVSRPKLGANPCPHASLGFRVEKQADSPIDGFLVF
jgi:hypothetical protein